MEIGWQLKFEYKNSLFSFFFFAFVLVLKKKKGEYEE